MGLNKYFETLDEFFTTKEDDTIGTVIEKAFALPFAPVLALLDLFEPDTPSRPSSSHDEHKSSGGGCHCTCSCTCR